MSGWARRTQKPVPPGCTCAFPGAYACAACCIWYPYPSDNVVRSDTSMPDEQVARELKKDKKEKVKAMKKAMKAAEKEAAKKALKKAKKSAAKELWLELGRKLGYCT